MHLSGIVFDGQRGFKNLNQILFEILVLELSARALAAITSVNREYFVSRKCSAACR